jgi:hypothetical protein
MPLLLQLSQILLMMGARFHLPVTVCTWLRTDRPTDQRAQWHYIDGVSGAVVAYSNAFAATVVKYGYQGGVFSPTNNRVYLVPSFQANQPTWHYIDCASATVVAYSNPFASAIPVDPQAGNAGTYVGGVYSPTNDRIYLVPRFQANQSTWHYIDCVSATVVAYSNPFSSSTVTSAYTYTAFISFPTTKPTNRPCTTSIASLVLWSCTTIRTQL